jgi:hypothetical protein
LVLSSVRDVRQWEKRRDGLSVGRWVVGPKKIGNTRRSVDGWTLLLRVVTIKVIHKQIGNSGKSAGRQPLFLAAAGWMTRVHRQELHDTYQIGSS